MRWTLIHDRNYRSIYEKRYKKTVMPRNSLEQYRVAYTSTRPVAVTLKFTTTYMKSESKREIKKVPKSVICDKKQSETRTIRVNNLVIDVQPLVADDAIGILYDNTRIDD